jgi:hypothetical protein
MLAVRHEEDFLVNPIEDDKKVFNSSSTSQSGEANFFDKLDKKSNFSDIVLQNVFSTSRLMQ